MTTTYYRDAALRLVLLFFVLSSLSSCVGLMRVERNKGFVRVRGERKRIICIDPSVDFSEVLLKGASSAPFDKATQLGNKLFREAMSSNAYKNDIYVTAIDSRILAPDDTVYFKYVAQLKNDILQATILQGVSGDEERVKISFWKSLSEGRTVRDMRTVTPIPPRHGFLRRYHSTPYFAVQGIKFFAKANFNVASILVPPNLVMSLANPDLEAFYYVIVADVDTSTVVYREYRKVNMRNNKTDLNGLLYDSFGLMSHD